MKIIYNFGMDEMALASCDELVAYLGLQTQPLSTNT